MGFLSTTVEGNDGSVSFELFRERLNRIRRETQEIMECWDNRLVIPPTKLAECYLCGHLCLHLHLRWTGDAHISRLKFPRQLLPNSSELHVTNNINLHNIG